MNEYLTRKRSSGDFGKRETLPPSLQTKMNQSFGMDFSSVKLYRNDEMSGTGMQGLASGNRVILSKEVDLNSKLGQAVLGHELSHIHAQSQGIGGGHSGLYDNAALEHQADTEGMMAANGQPIFGDRSGMNMGAGMGGMGTLTPLSGGLSANAGAPMQAFGENKYNLAGKGEDYDSKFKKDETLSGNSTGGFEVISSRKDLEGTGSQNLALLQKISACDEIKPDEKKEFYSKLLKIGGHAKDVDFGKLHSNTALVITKKILQNKKDFPAIPQMDFVGSMQKHTQKNIANSETVYKNLCREEIRKLKGNPSKIKKEGNKIHEIREKYNEEIAEAKNEVISLYKNGGPIGIAPKKLKPYILTGVSFNEKWGSDYNSLNTDEIGAENVGYHPKYSGGAGGAVDHEMGHQMSYFVDGSKDRQIQDMWDRFYSMSERKQINELSTYAHEDIDEFIAESWREYRDNPNPRPMAKEVAERLIKLYHQKVKEQKQAGNPSGNGV